MRETRRFPTARAFREALIWTLGSYSLSDLTFLGGELLTDGVPSCYRDALTSTYRDDGSHSVVLPFVPVKKTDALCRQILVIGGLKEMAGVTRLDHLPPGWRLDAKKRGTKPGLYRVVGWAFRNQRRGYCNSRPELTWQPVIWKSGQEPENPRLITTGACTHIDPDYLWGLPLSERDALLKRTRPVAGWWMLTPLGALQAEETIQARGRPGYNQTAQWLDENVDEQTLQRLYAYLAKKLPRSLQFRKIREHVHNKLVSLIDLDSFAGRINRGETIYFSQLKVYCYRSAVSDLMADGRDPVSRTLYGASTLRERRDGEQVVPLTTQEFHPVYVNDGDESGGPLLDASGRNLEADILEREAVSHGLAEVERALRALKPSVADRYLGVIESQCEGLAIQELADREGVGYDRASTLIQTVRNTLRMSAVKGQVALKVLKVALESENPRLDSVRARVDPPHLPGVPETDKPLVWGRTFGEVVEYLCREGWAVQRHGNLRCTARGEVWLRAQDAARDPFFLVY